MKISLNKIKVLLFSCVLTAFCLLPAPLAAQSFTKEEQAFIQSAPVIDLFFFADQAPYSYVSDDGSLTGISVDLMDRISEMSGLRFSYRLQDPSMRIGDAIAAYPDSLTVGVLADYPVFHESSYVLSDPYFTDGVALVTMRNRIFRDPASQAFTLAIPPRYVELESFIRSHYPAFSIIYCSDIDDGLNLVLHGKADFFAQNTTILLNKLSSPRYNRLSIMPSLFTEERMSIVGHNTAQNRKLMGIINKCIDSLDSGVVTEIVLQYTLTAHYHQNILDFFYLYWMQIVLGVLLLSIAVFSLVSWLRTRDRNFEELTKMNTRLLFAMEQANEAARAKSRFLLRISHDIRTPMNAIVGTVALAEMNERRNDITLEDRLKVMEQIRTATFSMEKLVDDVINRANVLEGIVELDQQVFDLGHVASLLEKELKLAASGRVNWISVTKDSSLDITVNGDEEKFIELIDLLIEDIVYFPFSMRSLTVSSRCHTFGDGNVYCQIKVTIVSAESFDKDKLEDSHRIPLANMADVLGGAASFDAYHDICYDISVSVPFQLTTRENAAEDQAAESGALAELMDFHSGRKLHMLVVDDNEINVQIARHLLEACHIETDAVYNGRDGVNAVESSKPGTYDAILMDIRMPVMNGNEATRAIRHSSHPDGSRIPIYAFSANYASTDIAVSINAGVDGYLKKPLEVQKLVKMLQSL
ncbi:MAG: response regulator [Treponemataceae bacterium]|nr:response regulator [Treponemataceae bacterium]